MRKITCFEGIADIIIGVIVIILLILKYLNIL